MPSFGTYGVVSDAGQLTSIESSAEEIARSGFCIVADVLRESEVDELNGAMEDVYAIQCRDVGGEESLRRMNDADIVRCPLAYSDLYMKLALNERLLDVAKALLGENIVLIMQNGVINRPDRIQYQTRWHRDLNYQHWTSSRPLAISALVCLENFTVETGGTVVLPCSHKFPDFPSQEFVGKHEVTAQAKRGSAIVFDSMLFHRAGVNASDRVRRAVNHVFGVPILNQQVNIPAMLQRDPPDDPWTAAYLGYRWQAVPDVTEWRRKRINAEGGS